MIGFKRKTIQQEREEFMQKDRVVKAELIALKEQREHEERKEILKQEQARIKEIKSAPVKRFIANIQKNVQSAKKTKSSIFNPSTAGSVFSGSSSKSSANSIFCNNKKNKRVF